MIPHSSGSHNAHLPLGLWSCRYGGVVGVTSPEFGADNSGDRSSKPSEAIIWVGRQRQRRMVEGSVHCSGEGHWDWAPGGAAERRSQRRKLEDEKSLLDRMGSPFCHCCLLVFPERVCSFDLVKVYLLITEKMFMFCPEAHSFIGHTAR